MLRLAVWLVALVWAVACASGSATRAKPSEPTPESMEEAAEAPRPAERESGSALELSPPTAETEVAEPEEEDAEPPSVEVTVDCEGPIPVFASGRRLNGSVCEESERFTIVTLTDDWTPTIFDVAHALGERGVPPYREEYIALANEDFEGLDDRSARRYLELLGIFPTVSVLIDRLRDSERHDCHGTVDDGPLEEIDAAGDATTAWPAAAVQDRSARAIRVAEAAQEHLVCDRLLAEGAFEEGVMDEPTRRALRLFQRKQMIVGTGRLDGDTARALAMDSREQDFRAVLRMLRERVVDATGVLADGSAQRQWDKVLDRVLDPPEVRTTVRQPAAPHGAPDRVSEATEAAAKALGLTDPESAAEVLMSLPARVAIELPTAPTFDRAQGDTVLWAEVHRGADPRRNAPGSARPVLTLYALEDEEPVALVRWPTTIGGYEEEETAGGRVRTRFFESPLGRRVWRTLLAGPTWLPPHDTPDETLIRETDDGWTIETALAGPGYDSAYGLMMIVHELPRQTRAGLRHLDEGIRTHGSVDYHSILGGTSHGCHRVYNHLAVRLANHLLAHRAHRREGNEEVDYRHRVDHEGESRVLTVDSRGYRFDFARPIPVLVIDGRAPGPDAAPSREEALRGSLSE